MYQISLPEHQERKKSYNIFSIFVIFSYLHEPMKSDRYEN